LKKGNDVRIDALALYQRSLLGGLGGLVGWGLMTLLVRIETETTLKLYVKDLLTGALIGLALGAFTGAWQGVFRERSVRRAGRGAAVGAAVGCVGGMIGLAVGELVFSLAGGGLLPRAIGWGLFGALVGLNEGLARRMPQKMMFGAYGGLLGGLIGGSTYESLAGLMPLLGFGRTLAIAVGGAVGLVVLGLCVGLMIAFVEDILRTAWLLFTAGRFEGQTRTLDPQKKATTIGRSELADICILADPAVAGEHARLVWKGGEFVVESVEGEVRVSRGGRGDFVPVRSQPLEAGDVLQIGACRARYQTGGVAT
jgi:hypothetical protein